MNHKLIAVTALFFVILAAAVALIIIPAPVAQAPGNQNQTPATSTSPLSDLIRPDLKENAVITSPLTVTGEARGTWYFEASFPVELRDANGMLLFQGPAQAQSDWMTAEFVPFLVTMTFEKPATATGTLIFKKDNPSGDPGRDRQLELPVAFN